MRGNRRWLATLVLCALFVPLSLTSAQTTVPLSTANAGNARDYVAAAVNSLGTNSYHYSERVDIVVSDLHSNQEKPYPTVTSFIEGDVAPGSHSLKFLGADGLSLHFERIVVNGEIYVHITDWMEQAPAQLLLNVGWYRFSELSQFYRTPPQSYLLRSFARMNWPTLPMLDSRFILNASEGSPELVGSVEARMFDVTLDGKAYYFAELPYTWVERLKDISQNLNVYEDAQFTYMARLWIDPKANTILKVLLKEDIRMPYSNSDDHHGAETDGISLITLSHRGEPVEIKAPTLAAD